MNKKSGLLSVFFVLLTACSSYHQTNIDTATLSQLESVQVNARSPDSRDALSGLRTRALRDTAMSLGAQGSLAWSSTQVNGWLVNETKYLDSIYNFNAM